MIKFAKFVGLLIFAIVFLAIPVLLVFSLVFNWSVLLTTPLMMLTTIEAFFVGWITGKLIQGIL